MNLIKDVWIPTLRFSGKSAEISPFEITSQIENDSDPIVSLNSPRPDFNGALLQFLTGLLQVVFPPENEIEWEDLFVNPPSPEILKEAMTKAESAFELFGDGSRFMQDTNLNEEDTIFDISALFIESPGENTIKLKKDFFIKRNSISQICEKCAGIGLFSFQTNSPSGGQGHLTSIRGGGPLTTFVTSKLKTLKRTLSGRYSGSTFFRNRISKSTAIKKFRFNPFSLGPIRKSRICNRKGKRPLPKICIR